MAARRAWPAPGAVKPRVPARFRRCWLRSTLSVCPTPIMRRVLLQRVQAPFAGTNPGHVLDRNGPDLAVTDPSGLGRLEDDHHHVVGIDVVDDNLHPNFRDEVDLVLGTPVDLAVATLAPVAARLTDRHTGDSVGLQGLLDLIELEGLDDRGDQSHDDAPCPLVEDAMVDELVWCDPNDA